MFIDLESGREFAPGGWGQGVPEPGEPQAGGGRGSLPYHIL